MNDGERLTPVTLTRKEPVAKLVLRLRLADALLFEPLDHRLARIIDGKPRKEAGRYHHTRCDVGERRILRIRNGILRQILDAPDLLNNLTLLNYLDNRQIEDLGKIKVALVMRGHGHDRASTVSGEHVVGNEDRQLRTVHRI